MTFLPKLHLFAAGACFTAMWHAAANAHWPTMVFFLFCTVVNIWAGNGEEATR